MSGDKRLVSVRRSVRGRLLTRVYIERVSEYMQRVQLAVLNGIDPEKVTQAMQAQCRLAASGDRDALRFVLSMVGMGAGPSSSAHQAVELSESEVPSVEDVVGYEDDDDEDEDEEDDE